MKKEPHLKLDSEILNQLAPSQLVEIIIEQAKAIEQLKSRVVELAGLEQNSSPNRASNLLCVLQIRHHYLGANGQIYKIWLF